MPPLHVFTDYSTRISVYSAMCASSLQRYFHLSSLPSPPLDSPKYNLGVSAIAVSESRRFTLAAGGMYQKGRGGGKMHWVARLRRNELRACKV